MVGLWANLDWPPAWRCIGVFTVLVSTTRKFADPCSWGDVPPLLNLQIREALSGPECAVFSR